MGGGGCIGGRGSRWPIGGVADDADDPDASHVVRRLVESWLKTISLFMIRKCLLQQIYGYPTPTLLRPPSMTDVRPTEFATFPTAKPVALAPHPNGHTACVYMCVHFQRLNLCVMTPTPTGPL